MADDVLTNYLKRLVSTWPPVPESVIDKVNEILRSAGGGSVVDRAEPVTEKPHVQTAPGSAPSLVRERYGLMTYAEAGAALGGVGHRTVARRAQEGQLVRVRHGRRNMITESSVDAFLEAEEQDGVQQAHKSRKNPPKRKRR